MSVHYKVLIFFALIIMTSGCFSDKHVLGLEFLENNPKQVKGEFHYFPTKTDANKFYQKREIENYFILWALDDNTEFRHEKTEAWFKSLHTEKNFLEKYNVTQIEKTDDKAGIELSFLASPKKGKTASDFFMKFFEDNLHRLN